MMVSTWNQMTIFSKRYHMMLHGRRYLIALNNNLNRQTHRHSNINMSLCRSYHTIWSICRHTNGLAYKHTNSHLLNSAISKYYAISFYLCKYISSWVSEEVCDKRHIGVSTVKRKLLCDNRLASYHSVRGHFARLYSTLPNVDSADKPTKLFQSPVSVKSKRRKNSRPAVSQEVHNKQVVGYAVGEELDLSCIRMSVEKNGIYDIVHLPRDTTEYVLMVQAKYETNGETREAFFFKDGGVGCWNMTESERIELMNLARQYAERPFDREIILNEMDYMDVYDDKVTKLQKGDIYLKILSADVHFDEEISLQKCAFANALVQSAKLAIFEEDVKLQELKDTLENETENLRQGSRTRVNSKQLNMMVGKVFDIRHKINLESGLLDIPDLYWERDDIAGYFRGARTHFAIPKRIQILNSRLDYCFAVLELLHTQSNDRHHIRLEWAIIVLIMIEVVFEMVHYAEQLGGIHASETIQQVLESPSQQKIKEIHPYIDMIQESDK